MNQPIISNIYFYLKQLFIKNKYIYNVDHLHVINK